ncbi:esterase/lipase family protein [Aliidiomarina sp. Khilg15.8]
MSLHPKHHPIIYVRGYAMTEGAMDATVNTPYMGFNLGSTRVRQAHDLSFRRYIFESPMIRLMKEYGYQDLYADGADLLDDDSDSSAIPQRSLVIFRYYEDVQTGASHRPSIKQAAQRLSVLIGRLRHRVCGTDKAALRDFKVYLVAHSMGGLICRCLLQNSSADSASSAKWVDKVFTYGTPHNGIEVMGMNVPSFLSLWDINNFNRAQIASLLELEPKQGRVNHLNGKFPPERFFCLVGTNPTDYGLSRLAVSKASDGLVTIDNAYVEGAPRVHTYTSHSGAHGMVNSKAGYDNLVRFLFGDYQLKLVMQVEQMPLPPMLRKVYEEGGEVRGSYLFECSIQPRGDDPVPLSKRSIDHASAVFRSFDELLRPKRAGLEHARPPVLASVFLDSKRIEVGQTMVLAVDLTVRATEFKIDGKGIGYRRVPDENLFRQSLTLKCTLRTEGWVLRVIDSDQHWSDGRGRELSEDSRGLFAPLSNGKGFRARLYTEFSRWQ